MKDKKHNRVFLGEKIEAMADDEDYLGKGIKNKEEIKMTSPERSYEGKGKDKKVENSGIVLENKETIKYEQEYQ